MEKNMKKYIKGALYLAASTLVFGCTGSFEEYNTNPYGPTPEQMLGDNANTASLIKTMIPALVQGQQNNSQMLDQMIGSEYGGHITATATWSNGGNYYTYNPRIGWYGNMFDTTMPQIYTGFFQICDLTESKGIVYQWARILRIAATMRVSDCYGPIPYSQVTGAEYTVPYDSMEELYTAMFADLDEAIAAIETSVLAGESTESLVDADLVFGGVFEYWVKFANTLKLRMALRIVNAAPQLAREKAEEAVSDPIGVMTDASESAWSSFNDGMNPYYRSAYTWDNSNGEMRLSANVTSYMNGYADPRLPVYAGTKYNGEYIGVRNGISYTAETVSAYQQLSNVGIGQNDKLLIMSAAEAYFLRAEGALRGWNMNGTAKELYEAGVDVSMKERGVTIGDYLSNTSGPANYTDPINSGYSIAATTSIAPMYDESAGMEANLERIMVQKWLANFPNGWETWADFRRTGYPKHFPIVSNLSSDGVTTTRGMRRLRYPDSEYNTNTANVNAAVSLLGGSDLASTDLWWAKKD